MSLDYLLVCRNLKDDEIINNFESLNIYTVSKLIEKAELLGLSGNLKREYLIYVLTHESNLVSITIEKSGGKIGESLRAAFIHDIKNIMPLLKNDIDYFQIIKDYKPTIMTNNEIYIELRNKLETLDSPEDIADVFINYYRRYGYGDIANYRAFRWKDALVGIKHFENMRLNDLIGYAHQKDLLTGNTEAFINNKPANNVLLVGARGTGKSSSVKALVNEYYNSGLRLVQITKPQLVDLPKIMEALRQFASKRFIIFLDDLSFEESDSEYKYLKSAIEGGVESRPENVLIYATSNRRHLIRETWRDRVDGQDDLYRDDSVNETISLSDRFGLIIHYYSPSQSEYLEIIRHMLNKQGINMTDEQLRIEGLRWEMTHSGRNGRTAQQFVTNYLGQH
ncbi:MAG: ATP-binding protein [Selenomonadaceae bacterium]|nr:ATP-binding protein [Selenomonadaceae bacterium]